MRNLPVLLRLTPDELQFPSRKRKPIRWIDIDRADVRNINIGNEVSFACIRLKEIESAQKNDIGSKFQQLFRKFDMAYDLILNEQEFSAGAEWLCSEFNRRISLAVARQKHKNNETFSDTNDDAVEEIPSSLGPCEATHLPSNKGRMRATMVFACFALVALLLLLLDFVPIPTARGASYNPAVMYWFAAGMILLGLFVAVPTWLRKSETLQVCTEGLIHRQGRRTTEVSWAEMKHLVYRKTSDCLPNYYYLAIETSTGKTLAIDHLYIQDTEKLIAAIENIVGARRGEKLIKRLREGNVESLGVIALTDAGMQIRNEFIPYGSLLQIERDIRHGEVVLHRKEGLAPIILKLTEIRNLCVIEQIAAELGGSPVSI